MEDKIEVLEYFRTKDGLIAKVMKVFEEQIQYINKDTNSRNIEKSNITKHSKNIIDLIEEGDLVTAEINNRERQGIIKHYKFGKYNSDKEIESVKFLGFDSFSLEQMRIISITTHEKIKTDEYVVGGNK